MSARKKTSPAASKSEKTPGKTAAGAAPKNSRRKTVASEEAGEKMPGEPPVLQVVEIRGARQNNLKGIDLDLHLGKLTVITGPSGSGKSSLAFQTIYAEGQRRYVETFSPYTRQFFDRMDKPQVDDIRGIPPAIAIQQSNAVRTTRSTVGTMTEINDYLKLLWPRLAEAVCGTCGQPVHPESPESVVGTALKEMAGVSVLVTFPVPVPAKTKPADFFPFLAQQGYLRVLLFGETFRTDEPEKYTRAVLPAVVPVIQDRIKADAASAPRLTEAVESAFRLGKGKLTLVDPASGKALPFSKGWHCAACDIEMKEPTSALFTFNNPVGACPLCRGFGRTIGIDLDRAMPDKSLSIREGVVKAFTGEIYSESQKDLERCAKARGVKLDTPFEELDADDQEWILYGDKNYRSDPDAAFEGGQWYGVQGFFDYMEKRAYKMHIRVFLSRFRTYTLCRACRGGRLTAESLNYRVEGRTLPEWWQMPVTHLLPQVLSLRLPENDHTAELLRDEIAGRLRYLDATGLGYLNLDRASRTLSGGETMRVNLTTCLGASLVNTLFVLDEPSVGLHPRDTGRLIDVMHGLRDKGNTLLVVEHEESVMRAADRIIEIGPGRGDHGGGLVFHGPLEEIGGAADSLTADYLLGRKGIALPEKRRKAAAGQAIKVLRATQNNLKKVDVSIPLGVFCCITGVSGSGKSTLVHDVLFENLLRKKGLSSENEPGRCRDITGHEKIARVVMVDQSPPSRTPRSTPAVYTGAWEHIRHLFAESPDGVSEEVGPGYFSFNSGTGRCERCQGAGHEKVEMQFLSDVYVRCPECEGKRFRSEALKIHYRGKSIHDVLEMTVAEAIGFFRDGGPVPHADEGPPSPKAKRKSARRQAAGTDGETAGAPSDPRAVKTVEALHILDEVGLGYLRLGQPLNTLSGGESQRLKLVGHLLEPGSGQTLFILDEPTTGLHFDDIRLLLGLFQRLVNEGHSLIVIEHNMEVIKCSDWVIDLGPEAGEKGGSVTAEGTPEQVARSEGWTGTYLAAALGDQSVAARSARLMESPGVLRAAKAAVPQDNCITIRGAREHNLKNLSVTIPRDGFTVVTGLSGSGKSTLAFDIIFAEGQRRFLDSMSTWARQFVEQMERPEVDFISGLPPTVAIEQRITRGGGKSTVATVTEVYHFLRLLWSKVGQQHCPDCRVPVQQQTATAISSTVREAAERGPVRLLAPLIRGRKGFHDKIAQQAQRLGCLELFIDGKIIPTDSFKRLERFKEHTIDAVVARLERAPSVTELDALVQRALTIGRGVIRVMDAKGRMTVLNSRRACPQCARSFDELDPRLFSFNSPHGWCPECRGYGFPLNRELDTTRASSVLDAEMQEEQRYESDEDTEAQPCPACGGARLNEEARHVFVHGQSLGELTAQAVTDAAKSVAAFRFTGSHEIIARDILTEIGQRLTFLSEVGLSYLQLNRAATTLSGGESQRIRLAAQLGSNLRGVLYVLDEPTIGLHPRDNEKLLDTLTALRDKGNSVLVVEHDEETMRRSDLILDLGPGAGVYGGELVASGTVEEIRSNPASVTGRALKHPLQHPTRGQRRPLPGAKSKDGWLRVKGARANNLKRVDISIPLGLLTVISGVSGSGKSSFMHGVLHPAVHAALSRAGRKAALAGTGPVKSSGPAPFDSLTGTEHLEAVYEVDQSPIGKTSRSIPATYIKVFDEIRALFAALPASKMRGYTASRFSFNTEGGRCELCEGNGAIKFQMAFLPTSHVQCEQCRGTRYNAATLEVDYNGRNIGQVMNMTIQEAAEFFSSHTKIARTLRLLVDTGTGYLKLGQPSPTLSGGEAQRLKLVSELSRGVARTETARIRKNLQPKGNLYLIEEPTIGLHPTDVARLIDVLHRLVDDGHTVVVIEHNLDVIREADHVIDIGPEAGAAGGRVVATGTPEDIAKSSDSRTGRFL